MRVIINRFVGPKTERKAQVIGGNHRPHRVREYEITDASLRRIERLACKKVARRYDGEEGQGYCIQTEYSL